MARRALQAPKRCSPVENDPPSASTAVATPAHAPAPPLIADDATLPPPPPPAKKQRKSSPVVVQKASEATVVAKDGVTRLTLRVNQEFATRAEARDLIHDFALAQGKRAIEDKRYSGGNRFNYVCNSKTPCGFIARGFKSQRKGVNRYVLKAFNVDHGAECTGKPAITQRQVLDQIKMASSLHNSSEASLTRAEVQNLVKTVYGTDVPLRMAYRAKGALEGKVVKDATLEIQQLESLLTQFQQLNTTSAVYIDTDEATGEKEGTERTFRRAFLKLPYADHIQKHCTRVLGLDSMEMGRGSSLQGGYLIELVARDGNNDSYTLAVALCDGGTGASKPTSGGGVVQHTAENSTWFLNCCLSSGITFDMPVFCDRSVELLQATEQTLLLGSALLMQCTQHLIDKVSKMLKVTFTREMLTCVWRAQAADTQTEFDEILDELSTKHDKRVGDYLKSLDPATWAKCCFINKYPLYNWQTTTLGESENPETLAARERGPIEFFQSYFERAMHALYARKSDAHTWLAVSQGVNNNSNNSTNVLLTNFAQEALEDQRQRAASCCVTPSDGATGSAYVWDTKDRVPKKKRVNVSLNSCSCLYSSQMGLPCKHLVAAVHFFNNRGSAWSLASLCHKVYSVDNYFKAYGNVAGIEMPVEEELVRNTKLGVKQVGSRRCSVCDAYGHNKRNCPKNANRPRSASEALI